MHLALRTSNLRVLQGGSRKNGSLPLQRRCFGGTSDPSASSLPDSLTTTLKARFPHIQSLSACQEALIAAITSPPGNGEAQDVILKADTGTGKSFGISLALISKGLGLIKGKGKPTTSLVLVPHRTLAYQYKHWIEQLLPEAHLLANPNFVQLCIRGDLYNPIPTHLIATGTAKLIRSTSGHPSILLATPKALVELLRSTSPLPPSIASHPSDHLEVTFDGRSPRPPLYASLADLNLDISAVIADELDDMLMLPSKNASPQEYYQWNRHKPDICTILDAIYGSGESIGVDRTQRSGKRTVKYSAPSHRGIQPRPQLIVTSATLGVPVRRFIFQDTSWMQRQNQSGGTDRTVTRLDFSSGTGTVEALGVNHQGQRDAPASIVQHSCIVVSEDHTVRNMTVLSEEELKMEKEERDALFSRMTKAEKQSIQNSKDDVRTAQKSINTPPDAVIGAIATAFALDVPSLALLVLPNSYPNQNAVAALKDLGVDARPLDSDAIKLGHSHHSTSEIAGPSGESEDSPMLLVANARHVRGLDFPSLTHVFVAGALQCFGHRADYQHIAGRVGRFGKPGKVVTIVQDSSADFGFDEEKTMRDKFKAWKITPTPFTAGIA